MPSCLESSTPGCGGSAPPCLREPGGRRDPPTSEFSPQPERVPRPPTRHLPLRPPSACARSPVCSRGTWRVCTRLSALPSPLAPRCRAGRTRERLRGCGPAAYGAGAARLGGRCGAGREPARGRPWRPCARRGCGCATLSGSERRAAQSRSRCLRPEGQWGGENPGNRRWDTALRPCPTPRPRRGARRLLTGSPLSWPVGLGVSVRAGGWECACRHFWVAPAVSGARARTQPHGGRSCSLSRWHLDSRPWRETRPQGLWP